MHKVSSPVEMDNFVYKVRSDGMADVWIRKNQEQVPQVMVDGSTDAGFMYEADEVYFQVTPETATMEEIAADLDFWFEQAQDTGANSDALAIANFRTAKRRSMSDACENTIYAGIDVELSGGTEHFSLTEKDQINLFGKQAQLAAGADKLEYHQDGNPCRYYTKEDMTKIISAAMAFVSFHTTYCNSMYTWIESCVKASEMDSIDYGADIPEEYQSEVLKDYIKGHGGA